jgi:DNA polymerase III sliding clamp (beta) subunit (PCNA family)
MRFEREELLQQLDVAKLAIDARDFIPILSHFCFHGKTVTAYNDFIGIQVQCKTNFTLALQANILLKLLSSVSNKEVDIGFSKNAVFFKSGASRTGVRARLPYMGEEDFLFKWPNLKRLGMHEFKEKQAERFFNGIRLCLSSVGDQMPSQMGVTLNNKAKLLCMYSTNNKAISKFTTMALTSSGVDNIILPTIFCQAILKGAQTYGLAEVGIQVAKDFVVVSFGDQCKMYGKLVGNKDPLDFDKVIGEHIAKDYDEAKQKVPKNFAEIFDRALLILSNDLQKQVAINCANNTVTAEAKSSLGKVKSSAVFKKNFEAHDCHIDAELAARAVENCDTVYFGTRAAVFSKGNYMHLLATTAE